MARITNTWVGYVDRSFEQIKASLLSRLVQKNPEITDHSETNILVIIISMFAGLLEVLQVYVDNMAREAFIGTARRFESMIKLVRVIDYRAKSRIPASADISFTALDGGGNPVPITANTIIPQNTVIETANSLQFRTIEDLTVLINTTGGTVGAQNIDFIVAGNLGTTTGAINEAFALGIQYAHDTVEILVNAIPFIRQMTLGLSGPADKHFIVEVDIDGIPRVVFGDGINGEIPPIGFGVIADYQITSGIDGNVDVDTITTLPVVVVLPGATTVSANNAFAAAGGLDIEGVDRLRVSAPLSIRTLDRAVTFQDYEDIGRLAPGVGLAKVFFECGKTVDVFIAPEGGGIASLALLLTTLNFYEPRRMVTTTIRVLPAGETPVRIGLTATASFRADLVQTQNDIETALLSYGVFENQNINEDVRISDVVALIDNLDRVDFLTLTELSTIPYARPIDHTTQLTWSRQTLSGSTTIIEWRVEWDGANFRLFKGAAFVGSLLPNVQFTDANNIVTFKPQLGLYNIGDQWKFKTYPFTEDIVLDDFTVPKTELSDLAVTVIENLNPQI